MFLISLLSFVPNLELYDGAQISAVHEYIKIVNQALCASRGLSSYI